MSKTKGENTDMSVSNNDALVNEPISVPDHSRSVESRTVEDVMEDSFLRYSLSVIIDRALPDVRDGLKPVHRRILYSMDRNGWRYGTKYTKSARITGDVMGKYHPHGDTAIYDAMARLTQDWVMRYPLVDGQGNFGSMDGDPPAAARYTEARMSKIGAELLIDLDKNTVDFRDNYDGSEREPSVLPAKLPNLLLNGQIGIAVGMATSIPTHNLSEIVDATVALIDNPDSTVDELMKFVKGPDFPTGGVVYGGAPMRQAYLTGRGSVTIRAVANIEETKRGRHQIVVTEIPYTVNKATLIEKIAELVKDKKLTTISDLRDESARGDVRIVIELKKDAYPKKVLNQLFKLTQLQTNFHYNMLAVVDGIQPKVLGLVDILEEYVKHRKIVVRRRTEYELEQARNRAHILEGLKTALDHIDEVVKTIRASKNDEETEKNLMARFSLTSIQAKAIMAMQLRRLNALNRQTIEDELAELIKQIALYEHILANESEIMRIIKEDLLDLKERYGDERRSKVINHELGKITDEELIPEEQSAIILTSENYIKRTLMTDYRRQNRGGKGRRGMTTKEEDVIDLIVPASTHDFLSFFTNKGRVFKLRAFEVPAASLTAKGTAAVNLLQLQPDEKITSIIRFSKDDSDDGYLFMCTSKGTVKKTAISNYVNIRSSGIIAIKLDEGDELRWIKPTTGESDVIISTSAGQAVRFNEKDVRPMGRSARGVRGVRLRPKDVVVGMDVITDKTEKVLVVSENGYGKMTKVANFPTHKRGGVGIKLAAVTAKTGSILTARAITDEYDEILMISNKGQAIRVGLNDVPTLGRTTQGVRLMRLNQSDKVASIGLIEKDECLESNGCPDTKKTSKTRVTAKNKAKRVKASGSKANKSSASKKK
ncbi:MAG: DNA gyrase subunit A [Candidatus Nanosyncoccaceae bacterium]|jgi:DNA gyrase subunit A